MANQNQTDFYVEQGGNRAVVASGGSLDVESGGEIDIESGGALKIGGTAVTASAAELNKLTGATATVAEINAVNGAVADFTFAAAAGASNICEVTITAKDADGATVAVPHVFTVWLSDAATGAGLTGTAASGTVTVKTASGEVVGTLTAKKALVVQALASGVFILEITDTAKTGFYVAAQSFNGLPQVSTQLQTADYGA